MMEFLRSLFGINGSSGTRTVVGKTLPFDVKDVEHIRESEASLTALYHLSKRYAGTQHEPKIKQVYEKTKNIHHYLVSQNRVHELALFHLRNTQHFINTFKAIVEVHQMHYESQDQQWETKREEKAVPPKEKKKEERKKIQIDIPDMAEMLINVLGKKVLEPQKPFGRKFGDHSIPVWKARRAPSNGYARNTTFQEGSVKEETGIPETFIPEITLLTYEKVTYSKLETTGGVMIKEVGYISTVQEKEAFLQFVSDRLEIRNISYVGNANLKMPGSNGPSQPVTVPIIHWQGSLYALDLHDFRLFPVKMYRKSL